MAVETSLKKGRAFKRRLTKKDDRNKSLWIYYQCMLKADEKYRKMSRKDISTELSDIFFLNPLTVHVVLNACAVDSNLKNVKPTAAHIEQFKLMVSITAHVQESV